jgi:hypothetical protein
MFRVVWYKLKIFLDWSFSFFIVRICTFLDFVCLFGFGPTLGRGGNNEQIRWESVATRPFWPNLRDKEAYKEWLLGSRLLDKDNTKQNPTKADV